MTDEIDARMEPVKAIRNAVLWRPDSAAAHDCQLGRFAADLGFGPNEYEPLWRWSISQPAEFWKAVWRFSGLKGDLGAKPHLVGAEMANARFFPNGSISFTENLLGGADNDTAVIEAGPAGVGRRLTYADLRSETARLAATLAALGVEEGDRVAAVAPNRIEALVSLLASAELGAIWTSCSPDFGAAAIIDRVGQIEPVVLIAARGYSYNGRHHDLTSTLSTIAKELPGLRHLLLTEVDPAACSQFDLPPTVQVHPWPDADAPGVLEMVRRPFNHPLYVLYTSGTTGRPKAIVHSAGGVLLKHASEHRLHCDVGAGDVCFWYTNTAWMMYHWLVSTLACGAAVVLYDDAAVPSTSTTPDYGALWRMSEQCGVTHFGTSPRYLSTLAEAGYEPRQRHDLGQLRCVLSAGSPVAPEQFDWVYEAIDDNIMFASISGGTEILGCFVMGSPLHPVRRGEITCKALGMAVDVLDDLGCAVPGIKGELVCTQPFPSMPLTFWGVEGDRRYRDAYFGGYPGIWTHGDLATKTVDGGVIIYGRTDTTLKPGGVRIGTAEIYRVVDQMPDIGDCVVIGYPFDGDEEVVLCIVPAAGATVDAELASRVRSLIRAGASPRHVPRRVYEVKHIPYTQNGKRVETAARAAMRGLDESNKSSLINPECLEEYGELPEREAL